MDEREVNAAGASLLEPGADLEGAVRTLLEEIGEDPDRDGLIGTPSRVRRMYAELTEGYRTDPDALINRACFEVDYDEMVRLLEYLWDCPHDGTANVTGYRCGRCGRSRQDALG